MRITRVSASEPKEEDTAEKARNATCNETDQHRLPVVQARTSPSSPPTFLASPPLSVRVHAAAATSWDSPLLTYVVPSPERRRRRYTPRGRPLPRLSSVVATSRPRTSFAQGTLAPSPGGAHRDMVYDGTETRVRVRAGGNGERSSWCWGSASAKGSSTSGMGMTCGRSGVRGMQTGVVRSAGAGGGGGGARRLGVGDGPQEPADMVVRRGRLVEADRIPRPVASPVPLLVLPAPEPDAGFVRATGAGAISYGRRGAQTLGMRFHEAWAGFMREEEWP